MNETTSVTPTVAGLIAAGYVINVLHNRRYKVVTKDERTGKIAVNVDEYTTGAARFFQSKGAIMELLPSGGTTIVSLTIPKINRTFSGAAVCRKDENYNKKTGVRIALQEVGLSLQREFDRLLVNAITRLFSNKNNPR